MKADSDVDVDIDVDTSCWQKKCKNTAQFHIDSDLIYIQLCKQCYDDEKYFRTEEFVWKKGIVPSRQKELPTVCCL